MKQSTRLTLGLCPLLVQVAVQGAPQEQSTGDRGPYEGVVGSENVVWVLDTRSGRVRKCIREFSDQTPTCSAGSPCRLQRRPVIEPRIPRMI